MFWPTVGTAADDAPLAPGEYVQLSFNRGSVNPPEGCTQVDAVDRPLFARRITMSFVMRCDVPLQPYPAGGIDAALERRAVPPLGLAVRARARRRLGRPLARRPRVHAARGHDRTTTCSSRSTPHRSCRAGATTTTLEVLVNGEPVGRFSYADDSMRTLAVRVPAPSVAGSLGDGRVVVRLAVPSESVVAAPDAGSPEGWRTFRLGRLTVEPAP